MKLHNSKVILCSFYIFYYYKNERLSWLLIATIYILISGDLSHKLVWLEESIFFDDLIFEMKNNVLP